ncbi:hypothetical protein BGX26_012075 [Mortierella sp. AD094]|nr:hypothetical protein BGX26_012075 [Mortierella sp. AD094]
MANGKNRLFWLTSLAISSIPLAVTSYAVYSSRGWLTIISLVLFVICLLLSTCTFLSWKTFKFSTPIILQVLRGISVVLSPLANILRGVPVLGKVTNGTIRLIFWLNFIVLMMSDVLLRKTLKGFVGIHEPSAGQYSTVNACDTNFQPCGEFGKVLDKEKVKRIEEGGQDFEQDHDYDERQMVQKSKSSKPNGTQPKKERSSSIDIKLKTPGRSGSDLTSMTGEDWTKALEMANIDKSRYEQDESAKKSSVYTQGVDQQGSKSASDRPRYSQPIATTLAMVSKLVYEDVPVIRHELSLSGYDMHSFRAVAYRNTCGFIVQKGRNIVLVFRGTDPLNLQNAWTDIQSRLVPIQTLHDPPVSLGKCHQGMYNALGKADNFFLPSEELAQQLRDESRTRHRRHSDIDTDECESSPMKKTIGSPTSSFRSEASKNTLNLELSNQSIYQTIATSIRAAYILIKFLIAGLFTHVADPVDYRFAGEVRDLSAFAQACRWVDGLRLEHAEKEFRKIQKQRRSARLPYNRDSSSSSLAITRRNSIGNLTSQDEMDYFQDIDAQDLTRRRKPTSPGIGSLRSSSRKLSLTGIQRHPRKKLSGHLSDNKDSNQWKNIANDILDIYNNQHRTEQDGSVKRKKLRFYICGHSLGGALATIFLAKMVQCNSPLLDIFSGLYTYGQPRIGDKDFSNAFGFKLACKMFHHVHNNDIFARVPFWGAYETPPGTLVFIDSSRNLTLYPPDPVTFMPVPVRGISFMHLSGLLNVRVIMRMRNESWLRILERIVLPFFLNDHFPGDYVKGLAEGKIELVVQDTALFGGVDETETSIDAQNGYFSFLSRGRKKTTPAKAERGSPSLGSRGHEVEKLLSRRGSLSGGTKGLQPFTDQLSGDTDSGYGAEHRSKDADSSRVRRRILKYTYPQDGSDDGEGPMDQDEGHTIELDSHWKSLAPESDSGRQRPTLYKTHSSSFTRTVRSTVRISKGRRGSVSQRQQQPKGEISTLEFSS